MGASGADGRRRAQTGGRATLTQLGRESGSAQSWNPIVDWRFLYQVPSLLSESPDVRNQLKGHQSLVGQELASSSVQSPQSGDAETGRHTADATATVNASDPR